MKAHCWRIISHPQHRDWGKHPLGKTYSVWDAQSVVVVCDRCGARLIWWSGAETFSDQILSDIALANAASFVSKKSPKPIEAYEDCDFWKLWGLHES